MAPVGLPAVGATAAAVASAAPIAVPRNTVVVPALMKRYWPAFCGSNFSKTGAWMPVGADVVAATTMVLPSGLKAICELVDMSDSFEFRLLPKAMQVQQIFLPTDEQFVLPLVLHLHLLTTW